MINGKKIIGIIPARGGSKGIKDKNIIDLAGSPLIAYSIIAALESEYIDDVIVSTDSVTIADVAKEYGADVPFMRAPELATDTAKTIDVVINVIEKLKKLGREYDISVLLQPTSPLRTSSDIRGAIEKFEHNNEASLVSVSKVKDSPILMRRIIDDTSMERLISVDSTVRRQDMPDYYRVNGSIYINKIEELTLDTSLNDNKQPYVMAQSHAIDIDYWEDLEVAKYYITRGD